MEKNQYSKIKAFTLAEMIIVAVIAVVILVSIPIFIFSRNNLAMNSSHGEYECYYEKNSETGEEKIQSVNHSAKGEGKVKQDGCQFVPPTGIKKFIVQVNPASGAGANAYLTNVIGKSEVHEKQIDVFNANIQDTIATSYTVNYPTKDSIFEGLGGDDFNYNVFLEDEDRQDIADKTGTQLSNYDITVRIKAPNGVKPIMQYYRPNINYPHYRGLALFGDGTVAANYITKTSYLPWPNLLRYGEIGLYPINNSKTNEQSAFLSFKEMFVSCSQESSNGEILNERRAACYNQCEGNVGNPSLNGLNVTTTKIQADPLSPLLLKCDNDAKDCLKGQEQYDSTEEDTFSQLPLPIYGRTMMVVIKDSNDVRDAMLEGFSKLFETIAGMCEGASNDRILNSSTIGRRIADEFTSAHGYFNNLSDAVSKLKESHRVTTYRNENANLAMQNPTKNGSDVNFRNPSSQCSFEYQFRDTQNNTTSTRRITVLNPEVNVRLRNSCDVTFNQHKGERSFTVTDSMCENEYPNKNGFQYPRGEYVCGVATHDQYPKLTIDATCTNKISYCVKHECQKKWGSLCVKHNWNNCIETNEICTRYSTPTLSVKYVPGFYNIEDGQLEILGNNYTAPVFQARCYAPHIFDKETLYVREITPETREKFNIWAYETEFNPVGAGGAGGAAEIKGKLVNGLSINFNAFDENNGGGISSQTWGNVMIPDPKKGTSTTANPYNITEGEQKNIFNDNHSSGDGSAKIWGIRSGMCDGTYNKYVIQTISEQNLGTMAGDGINSGHSWSRQYSVTAGCDRNHTDACYGYRGETIKVKFDVTGSNSFSVTAKAGSAGSNSVTIDEMPRNLLGKRYAMANLDDLMNLMDTKLRENDNTWNRLLATFIRSDAMPGASGYYSNNFTGGSSTTNGDTTTYTVKDGDREYTYTISKIDGIKNGVYDNAVLKTEINGTKNVQAEVDILKAQGGGSARLICDYEGNARSHYFTGKEQDPNIEIIPGRIYLKFTAIGVDGFNGVIGNSAQSDIGEHTGIVKVKNDDKKLFDITLGKGGKAVESNGVGGCQSGKKIDIGHPDVFNLSTIGFACSGEDGGETTVKYNNKGINFGLLNQDGTIKGLKGAEGGEAFRANKTTDSLENWKEAIEYGRGSFGIFGGQRIYVQLFFGEKEPICIFDSVDTIKNSNSFQRCIGDNAPTPEDFQDEETNNEAQAGKGAKVRIIW